MGRQLLLFQREHPVVEAPIELLAIVFRLLPQTMLERPGLALPFARPRRQRCTLASRCSKVARRWVRHKTVHLMLIGVSAVDAAGRWVWDEAGGDDLRA